MRLIGDLLPADEEGERIGYAAQDRSDHEEEYASEEAGHEKGYHEDDRSQDIVDAVPREKHRPRRYPEAPLDKALYHIPDERTRSHEESEEEYSARMTRGQEQ